MLEGGKMYEEEGDNEIEEEKLVLRLKLSGL